MNENDLTKKHCPNCGKELALESISCDGCGTNFLNETSLPQKLEENSDNLKTASQMIWVYIGNIIFWSFILAFVNGFIESRVSGMLYTILKAIFPIITLYVAVSSTLKEKKFYKGQKAKFIGKVKVLYFFLFAINVGYTFLMSYMWYRNLSGLMNSYFITNIVSYAFSYLIIPLIIIVPMIEEKGIESETTAPEK